MCACSHWAVGWPYFYQEREWESRGERKWEMAAYVEDGVPEEKLPGKLQSDVDVIGKSLWASSTPCISLWNSSVLLSACLCRIGYVKIGLDPISVMKFSWCFLYMWWNVFECSWMTSRMGWQSHDNWFEWDIATLLKKFLLLKSFNLLLEIHSAMLPICSCCRWWSEWQPNWAS